MRLAKRRNTEIIVALDLPTAAQASNLVKQLGAACACYKIGLELFAGGDAVPLARQLLAANMAVLADLKLLDIPATVRRAAAMLADAGLSGVTVHADRAALDAAVAGAGQMDVFAVTLLTSATGSEPAHAGSAEQFVVDKARLARTAGCAGIVCSVREAQAVRQALGDELVIITPGIRLPDSPADDQTRTATIDEAARAKADYAVVGRIVRDSANPRQALAGLRSKLG